MVANIKQPATVIRLHSGIIQRFTNAALPDLLKSGGGGNNGFRWDRPSDSYKRYGGKPPFPYTPDPIDQSTCGSCWACSVAVVHTARLRVWTQTNVPLLSPTPILSCVHTQTSDGCNGGSPAEAIDYCLSVGLPPMTCAEYSGWCPAATDSKPSIGSSGCSNSDIPDCTIFSSANGGGCYSCTGGKCAADAGKSDNSSVYGYVVTSSSSSGSSSSGPGSAVLFAPKSSSSNDYGALQERIMMEIFHGGPVVATYFVFADFYGEGSDPSAPLWQQTGGIYMNAPDLPDLYAAAATNGPAAAAAPRSLLSFTCTMCPSNPTGEGKGPSCGSSVPPASCGVGGHAVFILGFGAIKSTTAAAVSTKFSSIRGPLELLRHLGKPDSDVCCYWVCQNSWGTDWNSDQPISNSDGLGGGKWFHAMSGTYEFVSSGSAQQVLVNANIGFDHPISELFGTPLGAPGDSFGGVLSWAPADNMVRFPFGRSTGANFLHKEYDQLASSMSLIPCLMDPRRRDGSSSSGDDDEDDDPEKMSCHMVPAKFCTMQPAVSGSTCEDAVFDTNNVINKKNGGSSIGASIIAFFDLDNPTAALFTFVAMVLFLLICFVLLAIVWSLILSKQGSSGGDDSSSSSSFADYHSQHPVYSPTQIVVQASPEASGIGGGPPKNEESGKQVIDELKKFFIKGQSETSPSE